MNKTELMNTVTRSLGKASLTLKKNSPGILLGAGILGLIGAGVLACKATTKLEPVLDDGKETIKAIAEVASSEEGKEQYDEKAIARATGMAYVKTGLEVAKLYGPSVILGIGSVTCILASHNIIKQRNVALAAAYATVDNSFKAYRSRVVERFGEELDKELRFNVKSNEIEEIVKDADGKERVVKSVVKTAEINESSDFARYFNNKCTGWTPCAEDNLTFLRMQEAFANKKLEREGYLFLNDVYEMLGIPKTKAGFHVGWIHPSFFGKKYSAEDYPYDGYVDFGIYNINKPENQDFVLGHTNVILLDFNVDGDILKRM